MDYIVKFAEGFMGLFNTGAETFVSWVSGIVPQVLLLLIAMNTLINLIGQKRIYKFAKVCTKSNIKIYGFTICISFYVR